MKDEIITLYENGFAIEEIADEIGCEETTVLQVLEENNML